MVHDEQHVPDDDPEALSALHRAYRPGLMRFFLRRVRSHGEAEDLTQEVFVRLMGRDPTQMRRAEQYIFQVASNLLRDRARRNKVRQDYLASSSTIADIEVDPLDPHRVAAGREQLRRFNETLARLPERTRHIFLLFRYERLDQRTIAETFGISVSAVEKHIYRAMARLMTTIGESE